MTSYESKGEEPSNGSFSGFDHVHWFVGNAKMVASWYCARFGFEYLAYRGLETGSRDVATHVVRQGKIVFAFSSSLNPAGAKCVGDEIGAHLSKHGDGVKDVAFTVDNAQSIFDAAVAAGAEAVCPVEESKDDFGTVITATVKTYGDTVHTFVQRGEYTGCFLPGYKDMRGKTDALASATPPVGLAFIDHVVGNMPEDGMLPAVEYYERVMQFHRFWSVDDKQLHTEYSALRSVVMADYSHSIKMPINEPAPGKKKSQIQEYVDYYGGPGVQHIALNTDDIINAITQLRARGIEFLSVPDSYYVLLRERLAKAGITVKEDMARLQALNILVDFDDKGCVAGQCCCDRDAPLIDCGFGGSPVSPTGTCSSCSRSPSWIARRCSLRSSSAPATPASARATSRPCSRVSSASRRLVATWFESPPTAPVGLGGDCVCSRQLPWNKEPRLRPQLWHNNAQRCTDLQNRTEQNRKRMLTRSVGDLEPEWDAKLPVHSQRTHSYRCLHELWLAHCHTVAPPTARGGCLVQCTRRSRHAVWLAILSAPGGRRVPS